MLTLKVINFPPRWVGAITTHYHKEGISNFLPNTKSLIKASAVLIRYD